jgi:hypothetical protein
MKIDDTQGGPVYSNIASLMVNFNSSTKTQTFTYSGVDEYQLHPFQKSGIDVTIKHSIADEKGFTVPALSSAVFVK